MTTEIFHPVKFAVKMELRIPHSEPLAQLVGWWYAFFRLKNQLQNPENLSQLRRHQSEVYLVWYEQKIRDANVGTFVLDHARQAIAELPTDQDIAIETIRDRFVTPEP